MWPHGHTRAAAGNAVVRANIRPVDPRDWSCGFISRADVADFLVKQIDDDAFLHKTPVLKLPSYFEE